MKKILIMALCALLEVAGMMVGLFAAYGMMLFIWGAESAEIPNQPIGPADYFLMATALPLLCFGGLAAHLLLVVPIQARFPGCARRARPADKWLYRTIRKALSQIEKQEQDKSQPSGGVYGLSEAAKPSTHP